MTVPETLPMPLRLVSRLLQQVPHGVAGKTRIARTLLRSPRPGLVADRFGHTLAVPSLREPISYHLYADGEYEPDVVSLLRATLRPGDVFVDVGASVGAHTLIASDLVGAAGCVIAVEPSPEVRGYLQANLQRNRVENVVVEARAVSDHSGSAAFYVPDDAHFGMAALIPRFHDQPIQVETTTLDEMLERFDRPVSVLKVDVEGAEALVFRGGARTLTSRRAPTIVFEFLDWAEQGMSGLQPGSAQQILRDYGYDTWQLHEYLAGGAALKNDLCAGAHMLVAERRSR
jgi:FkbM family methyltransferase